jgi:hypothetical protein
MIARRLREDHLDVGDFQRRHPFSRSLLRRCQRPASSQQSGSCCSNGLE